ncbi:MAG TPA: heme biosynthesis HemY N-terminal domain-containing protein [Gammaproteobacteria bacterium]|nr:heme biosynthesis HemY N-terminal domain-containing protein [Gammaproteobacteria bacterium]
MRFLLVTFLALVTAIIVGGLTEDATGHVVFTVAGWTVQTSFPFFVVAAVALFILLYVGIRSLLRMWHVPRDLRNWKKHRHEKLADKYLTQGLLALVEGDWYTAESSLRKGIPYSKSPLIYYLGAARASQKLGDIDRRDYYLRLAHELSPETEAIVGLTQAELQLNHHQTEQALATLTHLQEKRPGQGQVKLMLLKTYTDLKAWNEVLKLLKEVGRIGLLSKETVHARQMEAYAGLLQSAGDSADIRKLEDTWQSVPKKLKQELYLLEIYVLEKLRFADTADCEPLLRRVLKKNWDTGIVRLYGLVEGRDSSQQLAFAESLLPQHLHDATLLLTLGRLNMRNSLWGKARSCLEESIELHPTPEAYRELAALLEQQGDYSGASEYYQQGLTLATSIAQHDSVKMLEQSRKEEEMLKGARQVV